MSTTIATEVRRGFDTPHSVNTGMVFFPASPTEKEKHTRKTSSPATAPAVEAASHAGTAYKITKTPDSPRSGDAMDKFSLYQADDDTRNLVLKYIKDNGLIKDQSTDASYVSAPPKKPPPLDTRRPSMVSGKENNGPPSGPYKSMKWNHSPRSLERAFTGLKEKLQAGSTVEPETSAS